MRLVAQLHVTVAEDIVTRDPTLWERLRRGVGAKVDLTTDGMQNQIESTAVVDAVRRALARLHVGNALSLVIDDTVVFHDSDGKPDDLPDLVLALAEHASLFGRGFRELRFAAEHEEVGLHLVIETRARTRHPRHEPAAVVSLGGRLRALEPLRGETADAYRARVEPLTGDAGLFEAARLSFDSFVARFEAALRATMPEATVEVAKAAESRLVKAPERALSAPERAPREPMHRGYDPFALYYPSPMGLMLDAMMFTSFMHMMVPPQILLVSPLGVPIAPMSEVRAQPELASDEAVRDRDRSEGADADGGGDTVASDDRPDDGPGADGGDGGDDGGWFDGGGSDGGGWGDGGGGDGGGWGDD